jgi:hypothetical protein
MELKGGNIMGKLLNISIMLSLCLILIAGCATRGQVQQLEERVQKAEKAAEKCQQLFELQQSK